MSVTIGGFVFDDPIADGGNTGSFSFYDDSSAQLVFIIPFSAIAVAWLAVKGQPHPYIGSALICLNLSWKPFGDQFANGSGYKNSEVTLDFGKSKEPEDEDLGDISISMAAETVSLPKKNFQIDTGGTPDPVGEDDITPTKIIPLDNISITVQHLDTVNFSTISTLRGKVNSGAFNMGPITYAIGQVLFLGAESKKTVSTLGDNQWTVTYQFAVRPGATTWNHVWKPSTGAWVKLQPALYESGDLATLFS